MDLRETGRGVVWIGFDCLRTGTSGELLWMQWWTFEFLHHIVSYYFVSGCHLYSWQCNKCHFLHEIWKSKMELTTLKPMNFEPPFISGFIQAILHCIGSRNYIGR
jgi:hypothetical protein